MSSNSFASNVRKWISRSEASDSDLPPKDQRLPEDWDEEDIIVNEDVAPIVSAPSKKQAPPAPITTTATTTTAPAPAKNTQVSSPGVFPDGFFASPKSKKPATDFPTATSTAAAASPASKKFSQAEEDARLKTDAAPGLLTRITGFFMKKQDGTKPSSSSSANLVAADASPSSPKKLTGTRREREESSSSDEEITTTGGDLQTQLSTLTLKQLEKTSIAVGDLKQFATENKIPFTSKSKRGDLLAACKEFTKKNNNNNNASPSKPRAASANTTNNVVGAASPSAIAVAAASPVKTAASPQQQQPKKKVRGPVDEKRLFGAPPISINKNDEPQEEWCAVQLKEWAKDNKVDVKDLYLKREILQKCWAAYDAKQ